MTSTPVAPGNAEKLRRPAAPQAHAAVGAAHAEEFNALDVFQPRHIGPREGEIAEMLSAVGCATLDDLTEQAVPAGIRLSRGLYLDGLPATRERGEFEVLQELRTIASQNKVMRSFIGMGYHDTITPPVILRNIIENPGWYTQYTPYQAEIAQGRLEALLNFQTMVSDLTGLPLAGASLLDEGTAAAEAMAMCWSIGGAGTSHHEGSRHAFFVCDDCHPQTIAVCRTRAENLGMTLIVGDRAKLDGILKGAGAEASSLSGVLLQHPATDGTIADDRARIENIHKAGAQVVIAADPLALALITPPGELGADIAVGSTQRFGVPMGAGGPHAAYIATKLEHARRMPGRLIGVSKDAQGNPALRMAIQTREQHIKREKATSNICTAQALLAICASMYAVYHGPEGLKKIASRVHAHAAAFVSALGRSGHQTPSVYFDTIRVKPVKRAASEVLATIRVKGMNLRDFGDGTLGIAFDETATLDDLARLCECFGIAFDAGIDASSKVIDAARGALARHAGRTSEYLTHPVFNTHRSESQMLRYIFRLQGRDLSLAHSMIPLGSCTMKLNATSEMIPVTWPEFGRIHPFAPADQVKGYHVMYAQLERWLAEITGFSAMSLQPNAGSQGEYAGLLVIRAYHHARGDKNRDVCLIPESAHGTNPASAITAGFRVVVVANKPNGDVDIDDLKKKIAEHRANLGALMVTYPSTYGVFEEEIREICSLVHEAGGQVYMDGANMNAQVGVCRPGDIGADVCHLNLHKTFCIPHGGGGPGMGPIGVAKHLAPFLPGHPVSKPASAGEKAIGPVSAAPYGSPSILTISWMYIAMMGAMGLKRATQVAILNANYMASRLKGHYEILYKGKNGRCAHEFIIDVRPFDKSAGIKPDDIAKRLMDFGFHAPTMSWPVPGTLMVEPTESEDKGELDRFCDAMISIRGEIRAIEEGRLDRADNPLKHAPHTQFVCTASEWKHPYSRQQAAFPLEWVRVRKFWPAVGRVDNPYGDRNLVCTCPPMSEYAS